VVAGHINECGAQSTGGNCLIDWWTEPNMAEVGFPIVEASPDGTFVVTKHPNTGGRVTRGTLTEQILYEMGDPAEYITPDVVAGHSLGEFSAGITAGCLDIRQGSALVAARGAAMGAACRQNPGTMAAVVKLNPDAVAVLVDRIPDLVIANDNAPGQAVVAGTPEAVAAVRDLARDAGGRALPLDVEGAFHSPAMAPAVDAVAAHVADLQVRDPAITLVSGSTAAPVTSGAEVARAFVDGILSPVRWREVQEQFVELGVTHLVEVGPGGVLAGLAKRTIPDVAVHRVEAPNDVAALVATLDHVGDVR
jgi:[acyl-carrier-protein] S-malonyltransferase